MLKRLIIVGACAVVGTAGAVGGVASASKTAASKAAAPIPRLAEFRVKTYRSGFQELSIGFDGQLPSCYVVQDPTRIKLIFKAKGASWKATNTWCMDGCQCALGEGIWVPTGTDFGMLFDNSNNAIAAKKLLLAPTDAFGGVELHKTFPLGYWVIIDGKLARSGRLDLRIDKHYRTIWEDEDDFINICINDTKKLYSSGGRLHCFDVEFAYKMKLVR